MYLKNKFIFTLSLFLPMLLIGEIHYSHSGYASATTVNRLSDGSIIKLPYRVLSYEPVLSYNNFNIIANTALEFRLKDIETISDKIVLNSENALDLRELYIEWMTPLGDFSLGKQIITWGSASENNPTDNISPYNYYYLFSMGKEKKEGIFSLNSTIYYQDLKFNAIFIPQHKANILPLNDPEFPIGSSALQIDDEFLQYIDDPSSLLNDDRIMNIETPYEIGLSLILHKNKFDLTTSYFSGFDRIPSFFGINVWTNLAEDQSSINPDIVFSYRKIDVIGVGLSSYHGDLIFRSEFGFFNTRDQINNKDELIRNFEEGKTIIMEECEIENEQASNSEQFPGLKNCEDEPKLWETLLLDNRAKYYQYVIEFEYSLDLDLNFLCQYSRYKPIDFGIADSLTTSPPIHLDPKALFNPGMGSPNTFISTNSLSISARKLFPDMDLELSYTSMFDLDEKGSLHGVGLEYEIFYNTNLQIELTKIIDNEEIQMNPFTNMKEFSRVLFELNYYY